MTANSVLYDLDALYIEIDPRQQAQAQQQSQSRSSPHRNWDMYINQIGLDALLSWFRSEGISAKPVLAAPLRPTVWELVDGSAVDCQGARLVVLPTEMLDDDELRVPQAWVDIPSWVGDYYLLLQVNPDENWARFAGFATHQDLKTKGHYDWRDRTYSLDAADLTTDLNVLHLAQELYPEAVKRAAVTELPALPVAQARQLIERLASPTVVEPRLAVGFELWGALLSHGGWRRQLAEHRWGRTAFSLRQWLQSGAEQLTDQLASQLGWQQMAYQPVAVSRSLAEDTGVADGQRVLCRGLTIENEPYMLQVIPLPAADNAWRFELTKATGPVPAGVSLELLTEDLQPFENNQAIATEAIERLYVDVALAEQEGIVWQTQPTPQQYDYEILQF